VRKRSEKDIWKNLYEFPLIEMEAHPTDEDHIKAAILAQFFPEGLPKDVFLPIISKKYQQTLTHQLVSTWFCTLYLPINYRARLLSNPVMSGFQQVHRAQLTETMAVPRVIAWFLSEKSPVLSLF
jgi:A/G-specific adenine glycosylase